MRILRLTLLLAMGLVLFYGDQFTKELMIDLWDEGTIPMQVTSFFNLVLTWNKGVSFGFLGGVNADNMPYYLAGFSLIVSIALLIWLFIERVLLIQAGLSFIIAGAIGNAYDRLNYHAVVDFLQFHYSGWYFPAFNVADICINIGVGLVLIDLLFFSPHRDKTSIVD